ncbi:hypothetical protein [Streptomyces sp. NPDC059783]|uniref:hypothetical protein n=1 Tax=Streptomyces sp. NPDC059783 TaxID=3346944 RepID=UPI003658C954
MVAQLKGTVYITDPDTRQTVSLPAGTSPEPRLAALVTNPAAWVDGKLPRLPKTRTDSDSGSDPGAASGDNQEAGAADTQSEDTASDDTKPAAKRAARKPARGRTAADEGTGGQ